VRTAFHEKLDGLASSIAEMSGLAGASMERATQALLQADLLLAEDVISDNEDIVLRAAAAEAAAFSLLALQAPVAGDLRAVISTIRSVADVDRMGALALHVAKLARRRHPAKAMPEEVNGYFTEMGRIAVDMGNSVKGVVLSQDPDWAAQLDDDDDDMDNLHRHLFTVLMEREWKHGAAAAVDVTVLSRYYERFADHAVEIARRVIFQVTGESAAAATSATVGDQP
jgi:phosphate transport system protein